MITQFHLVGSACVILSVCLLASVALAETPPVSPWEQQALEARRVLTGKVALENRSKNAVKKLEQSQSYEIVFRGASILEIETVGSERTAEILHDGVITKYSWPEAERGPHDLLPVVQRESVDAARRGRSDRRFDPRVLGMALAVMPALHGAALDRTVGSLNRLGETRESDVELEGVPCRLVQYVRPHGGEVSIWFSRSHGGSVLRIEGTTKHSAVGPVKMQLDNRLKNWGRAEQPIWYPEEVVYQEFWNDTLNVLDVTRVVQAEFRDVADEEFSLAALNLPPGTFIIDNAPLPQQPGLYWNGQELAVQGAGDDLPGVTPRDVAGQQNRNWGRWLLAINLAVLAGVLVVVGRRFAQTTKGAASSG